MRLKYLLSFLFFSPVFFVQAQNDSTPAQTPKIDFIRFRDGKILWGKNLYYDGRDKKVMLDGKEYKTRTIDLFSRYNQVYARIGDMLVYDIHRACAKRDSVSIFKFETNAGSNPQGKVHYFYSAGFSKAKRITPARIIKHIKGDAEAEKWIRNAYAAQIGSNICFSLAGAALIYGIYDIATESNAPREVIKASEILGSGALIMGIVLNSAKKPGLRKALNKYYGLGIED